MDKHQLISKLNDMTIELGRLPTRDEFCREVKNGKNLILIQFGSFTTMCQAAGLGDQLQKNRRITNDIFKKDLEEVLSNYEPREIIEKPRYTPTLVIGDTHFPFVSQRVLDAIYEYANKYKPQRIVQVGDLYDMYCHTKFPRSQNIYNPKQEEDLAVAGAKEMWKILRGICPNSECVQLRGNHDIRPIKRTLESLPSVEHIVEKHLTEIMSFEGVTQITDSRQEYIVEGIEFIHGYKSRIGDHRDYALMNAVCGHLHKIGVSYRRIRGQTLWEMNAGLVGDPESKALAYTGQKIYDAINGFGFIDEYGPRVISV